MIGKYRRISYTAERVRSAAGLFQFRDGQSATPLLANCERVVSEENASLITRHARLTIPTDRR
jgi:hypothetical protein